MSAPTRTGETVELGSRLRDFREARGVAAEDVARALSVARETYLKYELGWNSFSPKIDPALARGLGVALWEVQELLGHPRTGDRSSIRERQDGYWSLPPEIRDLLAETLPPSDVDQLAAILQSVVSLSGAERQSALVAAADLMRGRLARIEADGRRRDRARRNLDTRAG